MATTQSRKSAAQSAAAQAVDFDPQAALAGLEEDTPVASPAAQTAIPNGRTGGSAADLERERIAGMLRGLREQYYQQLGISVRSLRRLVKAWQELGVAGLLRQPRSDQGSIKVSQEWQDFIVKTYKYGNRGSRQMSPAQVVVQVQARAQTLGVEDYPGRTTVYRILRPHIEKVQQKRVC